MLLIRGVIGRQRRTDETGAALVLVLLVMLVGFITAAMIAAAVFFVVSANISNKSSTQAFIAAESGRDQLRANLTSANATGTCSAATLAASGSTPTFTAVAKTSSSPTPPTTFTDASLSSACPDPTAPTTYVAIRSTGTGPGGSTSTVFSVYRWQVVSHSSPAGFMAGTNGSFHAVGTGGSYSGDLVVRTNNYTCSGAETIQGDLWVLGGSDGTNGGNVALTGNCHISGNVFAAGTVTSSGGNSSNPIYVGKSILAGGGITMASNGVTIGGGCTATDGATCGKVASGGAVDLTSTGGNGTIKDAVTAVTAPTISASWKHPDGSAITGTVGAAPTFIPPLNSSQNGGSTAGTVWAMTTWVDLTSASSWGGGVTRLTCPANPSAALSSATGPVVLDYSGVGCSATSGQTTTITLSTGNVPQDAVFLVAANKTMKVQINPPISGSSSPTRQLFFVHLSNGTGNLATDCGRPTGDSFTVGSGSVAPRIMVYTACGLNGTWTGSLTGQLYVGGDITSSGNFTCTPMAWTPVPAPLPEMACSILGSGGASGTTTYEQSLGDLVSQQEK